MAEALDAAPPQSRDAEMQKILRTLDVLLDRQAFMQMAGLQFDGRRDLYDIFGYDRIITAHQYREVYLRGGIAKEIVEAFPKATWRGGVEVYEDEDPQVKTPFEQAFETLEKKHHIFNTLLNADILAGLSTYSVILIGAPGDLQEELPKGNPDTLLYLAPFWGGGGPGDQSRSTSMRTQASDTDVTIETFEVNPQEARFGEPLTYRIRRTDISSPMLAREVHWSRVVHICEGALDSNVYGTPTLESIWNLLMDLEKCTGGGSESFFQRAKHALHLNIDKDTSFVQSDIDALNEKLELFKHNMTTMLPTRGVDVKMLEAAVSNFSPAVDSILKQIAGSKGIPMRILTGSEMGTLASEQDAANFDSRVQDRRTGYAGPMMARKLFDRLIAYGYLPTPKQYDVGWPVEENMDEAGKAAYAVQLASINQAYGALVITENEIREKAFDMEPLPDMTVSEQLSQLEKAGLADKLTMANKQQGVTVFTDDEIRKLTYDFAPLPDAEKVPIGAPERISVTQPPEIGADGQPVPQAGQPKTAPVAKPPFPRAAQDADILKVLEAAIRTGDRDTVDRIIGLATYKYASTQVQLPPSVSQKLYAFGQSIPDADINVAAGGREDDAHVTVKYGLIAPNVEALRNVPIAMQDGRNTLISKVQRLSLTLGKTEFFAGPDYDVVYVAVKSQDLVACNRGITSKLPCAPTENVYVPHATVAYVRPGLGEQYAGWAGLDGTLVTVDALLLTDAEGNRTMVPLS